MSDAEKRPEQQEQPSLPETADELYDDFSQWLVNRSRVLEEEIEVHKAEDPGEFASLTDRRVHLHIGTILAGRKLELVKILDEFVHYGTED